MQLGVGSSCTVTKWMFSPVEEGDEDAEADVEDTVSPSLTYASTATSDDSFLSNSPSKAQPGAGILLSPVSSNAAGLGLLPQRPSPGKSSSESSQRIVFDLSSHREPRVVSPTPPSPKSSRFLRLRRNGNDSDGGYLSDGGKSKKDKEKKKKAKKDKGNEDATDYESDGGYLSEAARKASKKLKKEKKSKARDADSPATDYETDGDAGRARRSKEQRSRKGSIMSSTADESDGGNLSEASTKRKGFFRLNTRSRKKRDLEDSPLREVPPVPTLPSAMLPIAERFLRSPTPNAAEGSLRTATPVSMLSSVADRESVVSVTPIEREAGSIMSREGLTRAFRDAHSVHRPSIDALATFGNMAPMPPSPSPPKVTGTTAERLYAQLTPSASPGLQDVPKGSTPRNKGPRPTISPPNTSLLAAKHVPAPLVLNSPTSIHSYAAQQFTSRTAEGEYIIVTPQMTPTNNGALDATSPQMSPARPDSGAIVPSPSKKSFGIPPSPSAGQTSLRPHILAYYGIPPPTPPPQGPLPDVPPAPNSPRSAQHLVPPRSMSADGADVRGAPSRPLPSPPPAGPPPTRKLPAPPVSAPTHAVRSASESDVMNPTGAYASVPVISEPIPPAQRGRVSPFPTSPIQPGMERGRISPFPVRPVSPRGEGSGLVRKLSNLMSPTTSPKAERTSKYEISKPMSAGGYVDQRDPERLDVRWQPRSASALDRPYAGAFSSPSRTRKVSFTDEAEAEHGDDVSELDMGDESYEDETPEAQAEDVDVDVDDDRSVYVDDSRPATMYDGSDGGDRSSVWSQQDSRKSFFDEEKSASTRERFVKQVEAMYGEYKVPPVPPLNVKPSEDGAA